MGKTIVELTVDKLKAAGFRAAEASPGAKMPALTSIAVAVDLQKVDLLEKTATLTVSILAPASMGSQACQKTALAVGQVLQEDGADCVQESCVFDGLTNLFCTRITAKYAGTASEDDWAKRAGFSVHLGSVSLDSLVSFTVVQDLDTGTTDWVFEIEEFFRPEHGEEAEVQEPFELTVHRPTHQEVYKQCYIYYRKRVTEATGTRQIRTGSAETRSVVKTV